MKITKDTAVVYKFRDKNSNWADITLREDRSRRKESNGYIIRSIDIQSDWGNYAHTWGVIGSNSFLEFLCNVDKHYFMKKTRPSDCYIYDHETTVNNIKKEIIQQRREWTISKEHARVLYNVIVSLTDSYFDIPDTFDSLIESLEDYDEYQTPTEPSFENLYGGCLYELPYFTKSNPQCDGFWEKVWKPMVEYWKEEMKEG